MLGVAAAMYRDMDMRFWLEQAQAELVADGRARTVDIAPLDLDRFRRGETPVEVMTFV